MTWDVAVAILVAAFLGWRKWVRLQERVASLELRLNAMQLEHDALMIALRAHDDDPTDPRMLS